MKHLSHLRNGLWARGAGTMMNTYRGEHRWGCEWVSDLNMPRYFPRFASPGLHEQHRYRDLYACTFITLAFSVLAGA